MDTSTKCASDFISAFRSWSYSPDACLLQIASLHVKSLWNPTFGNNAWILQDYLEYNNIFIQLEMILKERTRCILKLNEGTCDQNETLTVLNNLTKELVESLCVPNDPVKEMRLRNMWKDMEDFAARGIAIEQKSKPTIASKFKSSEIHPNKPSLDVNMRRKKMVKIDDDTKTMKDKTKEIKPDLLTPLKELPLYWKNSQEKLLKLEKKLKNFLKSAVFKFVRLVSKDKNKIIIRFPTSQNLLGKSEQNYNVFNAVRIHQTNEMLIEGLINYKYKRKRKMSEDAKEATFIDMLDNLTLDKNNLNVTNRDNKRQSMINQMDMALKYNNVLKVKQLMDEDDFLLLTEDDKKKINLKVRLARMEVYEIKQAMEREKMNKLKLSWEKQEKQDKKEDKKERKDDKKSQ